MLATLFFGMFWRNVDQSRNRTGSDPRQICVEVGGISVATFEASLLVHSCDEKEQLLIFQLVDIDSLLKFNPMLRKVHGAKQLLVHSS